MNLTQLKRTTPQMFIDKQVFDEWQRKDKNYSWGFLIEALKTPSVQLNDLARDLEDWLRYYSE